MFSKSHHSILRSISKLTPNNITKPSNRTFISTSSIFQTQLKDNQQQQQQISSSKSSLFADLTPSFKTEVYKAPEKTEDDLIAEGESSTGDSINYIAPEDDAKLQKYLNQKPYQTVHALLSPLKRRLYLDNVAKFGFFQNDQPITLKDGSTYKLKLKREEIIALEPSIYLRSWRIKSSVKKTNIVLRALKDLPLKKAITQLHFIHKKVARDLVEMLERGVEDAAKMNYKVDDLYIAESWVHTDGKWSKRVECKGRGRTGILTSRWVSVRFLLKTKQTQKRLAFEKDVRRQGRKVISKMSGTKIRGPVPGFYKW
ncbi:hypothetical protein CANARDRAFT_26241 [[Candida] arabinofermentans NRRL YB-2248]|uniref:Ribosomal protein L22 n=1 Tax=[Candida] arabinofermentans NRRL YB-2248 TaxID=983967 RepID=A0A1E4T8M4_9ASCO|nr:hypothetical protein CANARDRAFT_26241 [[Candida] arabinofermentans NRRL YB-2248]